MMLHSAILKASTVRL